MDTTVSHARTVRGTFTVPGDKSVSHRALMLASLGEGQSLIHGLSYAEDPRSTRHCLEALGISIIDRDGDVIVDGCGLRGLRRTSGMLDAGNSGTTIRLLSGILAGQDWETSITGDASLCKRPMRRIMEPLGLMGAAVNGTAEGTPPLTIRGRQPLKAIRYDTPVPSAQVKSAVLLAGLFADGDTMVTEAVKTRDHTERMLGLETRIADGRHAVIVHGGMKIPAREYSVPGDFSSAAFLIAAGLLCEGAELVLHNIGLNPTRAHLLAVLGRIGASIHIVDRRTVAGEEIGTIIVKHSSLCGRLDIRGEETAAMIDELPVLAVIGAFTEGGHSFRDAKELRAKESDRIAAMVANLRLLGLEVEEYPDGFAFESKKRLNSHRFESYGDHRIAMSFAIAGLALHEPVVIAGSECVDISFPGFWQTIANFQ